MLSSESINKSNFAANFKSRKGSDEGRLYEKLALALLAKTGYELSKDNPNFCNFAIGREVGIAKDGKFDDIVFSHIDQDNKKNFIFVQIKHKQDDYQIDSQILSAEASTAKSGRGGGMRRDFNLQKYFISYLSVKEALEHTISEEFRNGSIKYVVIFTNVGLNTEELNSNGFSVKKAPRDVINLFSLKKTSKNDLNQYHQLGYVSKDLRAILKKSSDLDRIAKVLAQYVVWERYRRSKIMGIDETPVKYYHVALEKHVIEKSDIVKNKTPEKQVKNEQYCEARFRKDFIDNSDESGSKEELRKALFETIRQIDESKQAMSDDELKGVLRKTNWKIVPNFGKCKQNIETDFPSEWITVTDDDITDFLKCLVFIVNQPKMEELQILLRSSAQDIVVESTPFKDIFQKIENTGPELRRCIEKILGIDNKTTHKEKWITGENVLNFFREQKQFINVSFIAIAMTLISENEIMQFGKFNKLQKLEERLDTFFHGGSKILCITSSATMLSSIKILQYLSKKYDFKEGDRRIYVSSDILRSKDNRDIIANAFEYESNDLLIIECRQSVKEKNVEEFHQKLFAIVNNSNNKKIIFIVAQDESTVWPKKCPINFPNEGQLIMENDVTDLKDFKPVDDPLKKEIVIFQGQEEKVSIATLTGINCWNSYVKYLSDETFQKRHDIIDEKTLIKILNNDEIEVGSKPVGISNLGGAYATMFEEIDVKSYLASNLMSQKSGIKTDDIFIMSGISGLCAEEKVNKLFLYLGLINDEVKVKNQLGDIGCDGRIQIVDDEFKDEDFKQICCDYSEKRIFWIDVKNDDNGRKFILQEFYDPEFYVKRKFQQVVIKKNVKKILSEEQLSEIFILHCGKDPKNSFKFISDSEKKQFESNCKSGKIVFFTSESEAKVKFIEISKQGHIVHLLKLEKEQVIWCNSHGSLDILRNYVDHEQSKICLIKEDCLIKEIQSRKVVILSDDPGMGKTTTLTKLYESNGNCQSFIKTHCVFRINLRAHLPDIRDIKTVNNTIDALSVIKFLTKIDVKLNNNLAKNLLRFALDKRGNFTKPLLLAFDGFDEVLDAECRTKITSLLHFLKEKTDAKIWITTRLHYKEILENNLSTFAIEFNPLDDEDKVSYIYKYLKDRLCLILSKKQFSELFDNNDEMYTTVSIHKYISKFLIKLKLVFKGNISRFIGMPLQLYLMLEGSVKDFKKSIENSDGHSLNFNFLGKDLWEIYENFIDRKYDVYFQKMSVLESLKQRHYKYSFDQFHKRLAMSFVQDEKPKGFCEEIKHMVLSVGIIKSYDSNIEFIHTTFRDYFVAEVCIDWIKEAGCNKLPNSNKQEYLLKEILKMPDYELIRTFINLKLKYVSKTESFDKSLKNCGMIIEKMLIKEECDKFLTDKKCTVLHIAVKEGNTNIVRFLLNSLKGHRDALQKFLFTCDEFSRTVLHLASRRDNDEIVKLLLDAAEEISENTLQELLCSLDDFEYNALNEAILESNNVLILKELLEKATGKEDLIMNEYRKYSLLCLACKRGQMEFVKTLLEKFENDEQFLKKLLIFEDAFGNNALYYTIKFDIPIFESQFVIIECLLSVAESIKDNNETLKKMLLPISKRPFNRAVDLENMYVIDMLLNTAKCIDDDYLTLKLLLLPDITQKSPLLIAAQKRCCKIMKLLLQTAADMNNEIFDEIIFPFIKNAQNTIRVFLEKDHRQLLINSIKVLEEDKYLSFRKKAIEIYDWLRLQEMKWIREILRNEISEVKHILDSAKHSVINSKEKLSYLLLTVIYEDTKYNALHWACFLGRTDIIRELISYATDIKDGGDTLKKLITSPSSDHKTPFEYGFLPKISQIIENLIQEAKNNNNRRFEYILEKTYRNYLAHQRIIIKSISPKQKHLSIRAAANDKIRYLKQKHLRIRAAANDKIRY